MSVSELPLLKAVLHSIATALIILGLIFIKLGKKKAHALAMGAALLVSAAFLTSYLIYHYQVGHVRFAQ
jgi:putative membrane protein